MRLCCDADSTIQAKLKGTCIIIRLVLLCDALKFTNVSLFMSSNLAWNELSKQHIPNPNSTFWIEEGCRQPKKTLKNLMQTMCTSEILTQRSVSFPHVYKTRALQVHTWCSGDWGYEWIARFEEKHEEDIRWVSSSVLRTSCSCFWRGSLSCTTLIFHVKDFAGNNLVHLF